MARSPGCASSTVNDSSNAPDASAWDVLQGPGRGRYTVDEVIGDGIGRKIFFKVLAGDGTPVDEPFFRDTVLILPRESVDIGLIPLDEGSWMMHCHILEHAEAGMMTMIDVKS